RARSRTWTRALPAEHAAAGAPRRLRRGRRDGAAVVARGMAQRRARVAGVRHARDRRERRRRSGDFASREPGRRAGTPLPGSMVGRHRAPHRRAPRAIGRARLRRGVRLGRSGGRPSGAVPTHRDVARMTSTAEAGRPRGAVPSLLPIPFGGSCERARADVAVAAGDARRRGRAPARIAQDGAGGALVFGWVRTVESAGVPARALDPAELRALWREHGDAVLDEVTGEFLIALWDRSRARALLAVDRFATYPLYWCEQGGRIGFSARPEEAAALAGASIECDWQAIFAYVYFHMIPAPLSIYRGVHRLDHGEALRIERGHAEVFRYWTPRFDETRPF